MLNVVDLTEPEKAAYQSGFDAGLRGDCPNSTCPFAFDDPLSLHWSKGWFAGDRETDSEAIAAVMDELTHWRPSAALGAPLTGARGGEGQI